MTQTLHRILMALGGAATGLAGLLGGTNLVSPQVMSWIALAGGAAVLVANQIRIYWPVSTPPPPAAAPMPPALTPKP